jgi:hypothetical protein
VSDVLDELLDRCERGAAHGLAGEDAEPGFDHVEPRGAGGGEVEADVGVILEPPYASIAEVSSSNPNSAVGTNGACSGIREVVSREHLIASSMSSKRP